MGPPSNDEDVSGDQDTCQYQRVYLPVNQVFAIGLWRCIETLRARVANVCVESAVLASLRMSFMWSLSVLLTTTFGLAVDSALSRISSRGGTLPALLRLDVSLLLYSSDATHDNNSW